MEYKLKLVGERPTEGDLVLKAEVPLSGRTFVATAAACLRRSLDHIDRYRHVTLGALATYEMYVPDKIAEDSELYDNKSCVVIIAEEDLLSHYIFYNASVSFAQTGRPCYPYVKNEISLLSMIDELKFLSDWAEIGFPTHVGWNDGLIAMDSGSCPGCDIGTHYDPEKCKGCTACDKDDLWPDCPPPPPPGPNGEKINMFPPQPPRRPGHRRPPDGKYPPPPKPEAGTIMIGNMIYRPIGVHPPFIG